MKAWEAGLTWVFVQSFVLMAGGFIAPDHPQDHAAGRPARLARRHLHHLHLDAARRLQMFSTPVIGLVCFAIILASWFGGVQYFGGMPGRPGGDRRRARSSPGDPTCSAWTTAA